MHSYLQIRSLHGYEPENVNETLGMQTTYNPLTCLKLIDLGYSFIVCDVVLITTSMTTTCTTTQGRTLNHH